MRWIAVSPARTAICPRSYASIRRSISAAQADATAGVANSPPERLCSITSATYARSSGGRAKACWAISSRAAMHESWNYQELHCRTANCRRRVDSPWMPALVVLSFRQTVPLPPPLPPGERSGGRAPPRPEPRCRLTTVRLAALTEPRKAGQRPQREVDAVEVILQEKHAGEACPGEPGLVPGSVVFLRC